MAIVRLVGGNFLEATMVGTDEAASGAIPGNTLNFEEAALPHLKSAFNLARWITRSTEDAEDVVQEAYLRAWRFFPSFRGGHARVWLMKIVRNTCYTWITTNRPLRDAAEFDEQIFSPDEGAMPDAEARLIQRDYAEQLHEAINELPASFREVLLLREIETLTYAEISEVTGMPMGTVMSSLSRARRQLRAILMGGTGVGGGDVGSLAARYQGALS
jgi:RNA polymerase sigma factor (sigma-70 family)